MSNIPLLIFQLAVLIFSVIVHEVAHGLAALRLGDTTARDMGRLTLNPLKHVDPFGSVVLPLLLLISGSPFLIGWAKPVTYNPYNLKDPRKGSALIGLAGPLSNFAVAAIFSLILRVLLLPDTAALAGLIVPISYIVFLNILLGVFNLVPLPPLDGSNILFAIIPPGLHYIQQFLNRYGTWLLLIFILFGFQFLTPLVIGIFHFFVGPAALF